MADYKFTVNCETNHDTEVFNTNDFNSAVMKFDQYKSECEEVELSDYDINIIDNRTGEVYESITYHTRRVTDEELAMLDEAESEDFNPVENLFSDSLAADIEQCLDEMSTDEFAELAEILLDMFDE